MSDLYVMAFRALVNCDDDVQATLIAETIREEGSKHLDPEEGDELYVAQVLKFGPASEPAEVVDRLKRARNDLIRTRYIDAWNVAKQLDQIIFALRKGVDPHLTSTYNHGDFIDVATAILERGEYPL